MSSVRGILFRFRVGTPRVMTTERETSTSLIECRGRMALQVGYSVRVCAVESNKPRRALVFVGAVSELLRLPESVTRLVV